MNKKTAAMIFLGICSLLAVLLATGTISPFWSGILFALALAVLGILARGFSGRR